MAFDCNRKIDYKKFLCGCESYIGTDCILYTGSLLGNLNIDKGDSMSSIFNAIDRNIGELIREGGATINVDKIKEEMRIPNKLEAEGTIVHLKTGDGTIVSSLDISPLILEFVKNGGGGNSPA